jgi:3-phosphoshikimate 1-carboxyvinyltransferase
MRLLTGILAAQNFDSTLIGDESLSKRPMNRVIKPLKEMGASIDSGDNGRPPLVIHGNNHLLGIDYEMPLASAQVKSCLLLAGLYANGTTTVTEPAVTRNHTEKMLEGFGYPCQVNGNQISIKAGGELTGQTLDIPADFSSATFFMVAATIAENANITLTHVGINPTRTGALEILQLMGADITLSNQKVVNGEPVADITVKSAQLKGIEIPENLVSLAIDEFPVLFVAAACAQGQTVLTGAQELRVKESDRIASMVEGLQNIGITATATPDGAIIEGGQIIGGQVQSYLDHRIAMSFAVASVRSQKEIVILDANNIVTSFPNFIELANQIGMKIDKL